uniref:Glutamyl-tRNA(Gln) amidotransferase subunit A, mitochondrial n=1 Tax=Cacopsylla melanoneura TaxID=428564 RepID=A0A8D8ZGC6_9HEMI
MFQSIKQIRQSIHNKQTSIKEITETCLSRIEETKKINAYITVTKNQALKKSNDMINDEKNVLQGVTVAIKDNFCTKGIPTTCASKMLQDFIAPYDATVVEKLKHSGAIIVGKTNMDEFAMGCGTVDSLFGITRNVWGYNEEEALCRIAGGSSGGSAVAVAVGSCFAALGSDTGGSTRNPASYCGVVGFKPSYGSVSRHGLIPLVNSMDVPGILTRSVEDCTIVYNVISGPDPKDPTTIQKPTQPVSLSQLDLSKLIIGVPEEYKSDHISSEVMKTWESVIQIFSKAGARVKKVSLPHTQSSIVTYSILNQSEVASNMARYTGLFYGHRVTPSINSTDQLLAETRADGFGLVVRSRILAGNYFLLKRNYENYFLRALKVRQLIAQDFARVWGSGVHALITPTTLTTAPLVADYVQLDNREQCSVQDYCTQPANLAGCPAISIPINLTSDKLPVSIQIMAPNFQDGFLLNLSNWLESQVEFNIEKSIPKIVS